MSAEGSPPQTGIIGRTQIGPVPPPPWPRYGEGFTGARPAIRPGDPGIDAAWMRRWRLGVGLAPTWALLEPMVMGIGCFSAWGPFGWLDTWQLRLFGFNNAILMAILFLPFMFLPLWIARPARISVATPVLLGMRQSFDARWGPRVDDGGPRVRLRRMGRVARVMAMGGAAVLVVFAAKGFRDASVPHALLPEVGYARLVDPAVPLASAVRVTGVVADRSRQWTHAYTVRQDAHRDVYYPLRPAGGATSAPVALVERDPTSPQYDAAPWNEVDAPGPREGVPTLLDDWTAGRLRDAGFPLGPRVVVLERRQLAGRDPGPDSIDDGVFATIGFSVLFVGLLLWWSVRRQEATFVD